MLACGTAGDGLKAVRRAGDAAQGVERRAEHLQPYVLEAAVLHLWAATIGNGAPRLVPQPVLIARALIARVLVARVLVARVLVVRVLIARVLVARVSVALVSILVSSAEHLGFAAGQVLPH